MSNTQSLTIRDRDPRLDPEITGSWSIAYIQPPFTERDFYQFGLRRMLEKCGAAALSGGGVIYDGLWCFSQQATSGRGINIMLGRQVPYPDDDQVANLESLLGDITKPRSNPYNDAIISGVRQALRSAEAITSNSY